MYLKHDRQLDVKGFSIFLHPFTSFKWRTPGENDEVVVPVPPPKALIHKDVLNRVRRDERPITRKWYGDVAEWNTQTPVGFQLQAIGWQHEDRLCTGEVNTVNKGCGIHEREYPIEAEMSYFEYKLGSLGPPRRNGSNTRGKL